jgi:hypothetical protein
VVLEPVDRNAHFRERRRKQRRRRRNRRIVVLAVLAVTAAIIAYAARAIGQGEDATARQEGGKPTLAAAAKKLPGSGAWPLPYQIRGVHVTMALASIPGKLDQYLGLRGLNTIELDVKDENGDVAFVPSAVPLSRATGAAKPYYKPHRVAARIHRRGVYLIGRVVVFEDPILSEQRPELAIRRPDGSRWLNNAGLGWVNPYDRRVWDYVVDVAEVAAKSGFDEIQFDYVRFPSDGDLSQIVYPGKTATEPRWVIAQFVQYAAKRLRPLGVRVSADVFGLSATRDLGIGQIPRLISRYVDAVYPMVYPSHYVSGEYGIVDPNASPGQTVAYSLRTFRRQLRGSEARVVPWLQDFSLGRTYTFADVQEQIDSARRARTGGYLLWNPAGVYTPGALAPRH